MTAGSWTGPDMALLHALCIERPAPGSEHESIGRARATYTGTARRRHSGKSLGRLLWLAGGTVGLVLWLAALVWMSPDAFDAHAYFVGTYGVVGGQDAYLYSPAFSQAVEPLRWLGWDGFRSAFRVAEVAVLVAVTGPLAGPLLFVDHVMLEVRSANIHLLMAGAILAGFRWPALWSFVLLTKVTPGVGLLWFAVRREWRNLGIALGATALIAGVSFAIDYRAWFDWLGVLTTQRPLADVGGIPAFVTGTPLVVCIGLAALLVIWGAKTNRRWTVIIAAFVALPVIWGNSITLLAGVVALVSQRRLLGHDDDHSLATEPPGPPS